MKVIILFLFLFLSNIFAAEIFFDNFESGTQSGWSQTTISNDAAFSTFLGRFGSSTVNLNLSNLAEHTTVTLEFDLYVIDSWDGESFQVKNSSTTIFSTTFDNHAGASQSYTPRTGDTFRVDLAYSGPAWYDSIYRKVSGGITFAHTGTTLSLSFTGYTNEAISNESWGIDNVRILTNAVIPEPCSSAMLILGIAALFLRKKKIYSYF